MWYHSLTQGYLTKQIYAETHVPITLGTFQEWACTYRCSRLAYQDVDATEPVDRVQHAGVNLIEVNPINEIGFGLTTVVVYLFGQRL